jgi:hypothetical protein
MKFDHAQHMTGNARPKNGCASCHSGTLRRGAALSIPAGSPRITDATRATRRTRRQMAATGIVRCLS